MEIEDTGMAMKVSEMCGQQVSVTDEGGSIRQSWMVTSDLWSTQRYKSLYIYCSCCILTNNNK